MNDKVKARTIFCGLLVALGCLAVTATPSAATAVRTGGRGPAKGSLPATPVHLYIAGGIFGTPGVYRFPVTNGLPATTPDAVLTGDLSGPSSVGFDGAGYMYVADAGVHVYGGVKVYAPGSTGNAQPVRVITSYTQQFVWLAVNKAGYLFVTADYNSIYVYPPGANGAAPPLRVITPPKEIWDLLVDSTGRLYANLSVEAVYVYNDPIFHWQSPDRIITTRGSEEGYMRYPMALDEGRKLLYLTLRDSDAPYQWQAGDHAARYLGNRNRRDRISLTKDCYGNPGEEYGMAEDHRYLMFSCLNLEATLVYHNAPGKQRLVEAIHPTGLTNPEGMIFGP
jgi:hypothetical protein